MAQRTAGNLAQTVGLVMNAALLTLVTHGTDLCLLVGPHQIRLVQIVAVHAGEILIMMHAVQPAFIQNVLVAGFTHCTLLVHFGPKLIPGFTKVGDRVWAALGP